jgi:DNA repair protein RecO (recombination protein O)
MNIDAEPAFVLHSRPYRETSLLVDIFSRHHGRFRAVARGVRGSNKHTRRLVPFTPYLMSWTGKSTLKTLKNFESSGHSISLLGDNLYCGLYLNELLIRLIAEYDPHTYLFDHYLNVLISLANETVIEPGLRHFELTLLSEIGYALELTSDADSGEPIDADCWYRYDPSTGFHRTAAQCQQRAESKSFLGKELMAIAEGDYQSASTSPAAKRLLRLALAPHIGSEPLRSRSLFERKPVTGHRAN